jgi:hypothetical protein
VARSQAELARILAPILGAVKQHSGVAERFVDKDRYRLNLATVWANLVMDPGAAGIDEDDLENVHDLINLNAAPVLGEEQAITAAFRFVNSRAGEQAMAEARVSKPHQDLLIYFCSMILDPDGHKRWMERYRNQSDSQGT